VCAHITWQASTGYLYTFSLASLQLNLLVLKITLVFQPLFSWHLWCWRLL